jgi:hypothetical protein
MDIISRKTLNDLIEGQEGKTISIYMPVYLTTPDSRQNPIRLQNMVNHAEEQLDKMGMDPQSIQSYIDPLSDLVEDEGFWQDKDEGLALFLDKNALRIFNLPEKFDEFVDVGDTFYIKPLIPIYKGDGQFFLLSLDKDRPKIYQGSKFRLSRVEEIDLPKSLQTLFDAYYEFHDQMQFHSKTRSPSPNASQKTGNREGVFFGHGGDDFDEKSELRNYYHQFDKALMDYLGDADAPMVLAGIDSLHPVYKEANSYPHLLDEGIKKDVEQMPVEELHQTAWQIVKNEYQKDADKALGVYYALQEKDRDTTHDIETIVSASYYKRINTLFIASKEQIWGRFDSEDNQVAIETKKESGNQELLNMAAINTMLNGGNVIVLEKEKMPGNAQAAAILRY